MLEEQIASQLSVVLPAFNEEAGIAVTLAGLQRDCPGVEIIVVDDASTDGTSAAVRKVAGVRLIRHRYNRGQGGALKTGMQFATRPYVAWFDADNEHRTEDLANLARKVVADDLVAVIGQRVTRSASLVRGVGKTLIRLMGRGLKINAGSDLNCGLRVFRREIISGYLPLIPDRFSASLMTTLIMLERRYPLGFLPIQTNPRIGTSTVRLKDGFEAILMLLRAVMLFAPTRVFLPVGAGLGAVGIVYSLLVSLIRGAGLPVGGMLLMVLGVLLVMLGLIADQISQFRLSQLPQKLLVDVDEPDELTK
jgi:glycosyltransferase involved in cell wall biosynthesis